MTNPTDKPRFFEHDKGIYEDMQSITPADVPEGIDLEVFAALPARIDALEKRLDQHEETIQRIVSDLITQVNARAD